MPKHPLASMDVRQTPEEFDDVLSGLRRPDRIRMITARDAEIAAEAARAEREARQKDAAIWDAQREKFVALLCEYDVPFGDEP